MRRSFFKRGKKMRSGLMIVAGISTLTFVFAGCASYNAAPLNTLPSEPAKSILGSNSELLVVAKAFNKADCKRYLDRDVIAKGYQPVQLYIQNDSDRSYSFSLNRISIACARPEEVAEKVHTSTAGRAAGYGAAALIVWPLAIPAVVDGVKSANANESLDNDFSSKTARDQTIAPHSYFNKLIFVPVNEYQPTFTVKLIDQDTNKTKKLDIVVN